MASALRGGVSSRPADILRSLHDRRLGGRSLGPRLSLLLFAVAHWGDHSGRRSWRGRRATIYALALAVYCTSWTFFGSVGLASRSGLDFLTIYIGPVLVIGLGHPLVARVVRIAKAQNITSIADFVAARYGKSERVAALVCLIAVVGTVPYIALQLKAVSASLGVFLAAADVGAIARTGAGLRRPRSRRGASCWPASRWPSARATPTPPSTRTG